MEGGAGKVSTSYRHLKGEWDAGGDLDTEAGRSAEASRSLALEAKGAESQRRSSAEGGKERHSPGEQEKRKSPSDPRRPIKLKMIPRNVTVGRGIGLPMGGPLATARSPSVPCAPSPACTRATHTAVVHSSGGHTLLRGTPAFQQAPTSFASVALRYGRRCSSPQTPQLTGCAPCTAAPRSAQTSPSGPRSPRLTSSSSDPWSALISKNHRTQSVGAAVPAGEMDWLPAPSPCSRKSSWSSVSTDNDSGPLLVVVTFAICLAPLACGFGLAYNITKNPSEILGPHLGPWKTYVYFLGCLSGGFFSGFVANYGRKVVVLLTMVPMALSWLFIIFATQVWMVFLFHATSGVCTGLVMVVVQVYVAEVSVPRVRGALSTAPVLAFQVGSLLCFLLGEILVWRNLAIVGVCVSLPVFLTVVLCMPESPRFLIHKHPSGAYATLQWLRGANSDVMEEYHDISDAADIDRWAIHCDDLLRPTFWRPLLLSCGLMFLYSMAGLSSCTLYGTELFAEVSNVYVNVAHFVVTVVLLVAITLSALLVDHIGRKLLLLLSLTIMAASSFVLGLFLFLKDLHRVENYFMYQWVAEVFCVVLFTFAYGSGLAPIAWVTLGEIFSPQYKWLGVSMASMVLWSSMLAVEVLFHRLRVAVATGGIFWMHCVVCVAGYIFVLVCFRELKEQRIDSITKSFVKKHDSLIETFMARACEEAVRSLVPPAESFVRIYSPHKSDPRASRGIKLLRQVHLTVTG